jgi:hypothetical protein
MMILPSEMLMLSKFWLSSFLEASCLCWAFCYIYLTWQMCSHTLIWWFIIPAHNVYEYLLLLVVLLFEDSIDWLTLLDTQDDRSGCNQVQNILIESWLESLHQTWLGWHSGFETGSFCCLWSHKSYAVEKFCLSPHSDVLVLPIIILSKIISFLWFVFVW